MTKDYNNYSYQELVAEFAKIKKVYKKLENENIIKKDIYQMLLVLLDQMKQKKDIEIKRCPHLTLVVNQRVYEYTDHDIKRVKYYNSVCPTCFKSFKLYYIFKGCFIENGTDILCEPSLLQDTYTNGNPPYKTKKYKKI